MPRRKRMLRDSTHLEGLHEGYNATIYDEVRGGKPKWRREHVIVEQFLRRVAPSVVLDVPVGTGRFIDIYHELGAQFTGVDLSEDMLAIARGRTEVGRLAQGDITALDLADSSVDLALCIRMLNLVDFAVAQDAIAELVRVTSGHLVIGITVRRSVFSDMDDGPIAAVRRAARQLKVRYRGGPRKVITHPEKAFLREVERHGLRIEDRQRVNVRSDGSTYFIYLLAT